MNFLAASSLVKGYTSYGNSADIKSRVREELLSRERLSNHCMELMQANAKPSDAGVPTERRR